MRTYGRYCPIARGAEIFAERWTPLIIRNLHLGCESFDSFRLFICQIKRIERQRGER